MRLLPTLHLREPMMRTKNQLCKAKLFFLGARGHTGAELLRLLDKHGGFDLQTVSSRALVGSTLGEANPHLSPDCPFRDLEVGSTFICHTCVRL